MLNRLLRPGVTYASILGKFLTLRPLPTAPVANAARSITTRKYPRYVPQRPSPFHKWRQCKLRLYNRNAPAVRTPLMALPLLKSSLPGLPLVPRRPPWCRLRLPPLNPEIPQPVPSGTPVAYGSLLETRCPGEEAGGHEEDWELSAWLLPLRSASMSFLGRWFKCQ